MAGEPLPVRVRAARSPLLVAVVVATLLLSSVVVLGVRAFGGPEALVGQFGPFAPLVGALLIAVAGLQPFPGGEFLLVARRTLRCRARGGGVPGRQHSRCGNPVSARAAPHRGGGPERHPNAGLAASAAGGAPGFSNPGAAAAARWLCDRPGFPGGRRLELASPHLRGARCRAGLLALRRDRRRVRQPLNLTRQNAHTAREGSAQPRSRATRALRMDQVEAATYPCVAPHGRTPDGQYECDTPRRR